MTRRTPPATRGAPPLSPTEIDRLEAALDDCDDPTWQAHLRGALGRPPGASFGGHRLRAIRRLLRSVPFVAAGAAVVVAAFGRLATLRLLGPVLVVAGLAASLLRDALGNELPRPSTRRPPPTPAELLEVLVRLPGEPWESLVRRAGVAMEDPAPVPALLGTLEYQTPDGPPWTRRLLARPAEPWDERFVASCGLMARGSEALGDLALLSRRRREERASPWLVDEPLALMDAIVEDSRNRLAEVATRPVCARCVAFMAGRTERWITGRGPVQREVWGCPSCGSSRTARDAPGGIEVVLDDREDATAPPVHLRDGVLIVSWSRRRRACELDRVRIVSASDRDVEQFVIQLENAADDTRSRALRRTPCSVASTCDLGENSLRLLARTFGSVTRGPAASEEVPRPRTSSRPPAESPDPIERPRPELRRRAGVDAPPEVA